MHAARMRSGGGLGKACLQGEDTHALEAYDIDTCRMMDAAKGIPSRRHKLAESEKV